MRQPLTERSCTVPDPSRSPLNKTGRWTSYRGGPRRSTAPSCSVSCVCRVGASIASVATNARDATARPLDSHSGSTLSRSKGRLSSPKSDAIDALRKSRYGRATLKTNVVVRGAGLLSPVGFEAVAEKCQRGFQGHLSGLGTIDVFAHLIAKGVRHAVVG